MLNFKNLRNVRGARIIQGGGGGGGGMTPPPPPLNTALLKEAKVRASTREGKVLKVVRFLEKTMTSRLL